MKKYMTMRRFISRAAMTLLLCVLTAATAGAETIVENVAYVDANGNAQTASAATVVTSDMGGTSTANPAVFTAGSTSIAT